MKNRDIPLGKTSEYRFEYDPDQLYTIARAQTREALALPHVLPFTGEDIWTAYELSWLNSRGLPQTAIAEFRFPCDSPRLVESKSFKLYLNSLNQTRFDSTEQLLATLKKDLTNAVEAAVQIALVSDLQTELSADLAYQCLDTLSVECSLYQPDAALLDISRAGQVQQRWYSRLFRSLCPVTGQPDWADIFIDYHGPELKPQSLLQYLVSYRQHQGFHEQCVEQIFQDILKNCQADRLSVYARFLRRGGLDINPWRSTHAGFPDNLPGRQPRQ